MSKVTLSTYDRLGKQTSMTMAAPDGDITVNVEALVAAVQAVILGSDIKAVQAVETEIEAGSAVAPTDDLANRGMKWLLRFQDSTTGRLYNHEIGTADFTALPTPNTDYLDLSAGVGLALKTAIEAVWRSPGGNAGVLLSVQQVTRTE